MYDMADGSSPFAQYDLTGAPVYVNGTPTVNPASGYNDEAMWSNRDPRLEATVLHHGFAWGNSTVRPDNRINVIYGMADNPAGNANSTPTGYYMAKYIPAEILSGTHAGSAYRLWTIIRYAEILLNYAEALNEAGRTSEAYDYVDQVRARVNMPSLRSRGLDQSALRERIRNERRIELCFEDHRFFDERRWKLFDENRNAAAEASLPRYRQVFTLYGVEVRENTNTTFNYGTSRVDGRRTFNSPKNYFFPIPYDEVRKAGIVQNPGWEL